MSSLAFTGWPSPGVGEGTHDRRSRLCNALRCSMRLCLNFLAYACMRICGSTGTTEREREDRWSFHLLA